MKNHFWYSAFVAVLLMTALQCSHKTELNPKGEPFTDSLYGTTLVRITDQETDGYSGNGIENEYAKADAYNCDNTFMVLRGNDGVYYLYNALTYALIRDLNDLSGGQELEPRWHELSPDLLYALSGSQLVEYSVASATIRTVHDFKDEFPACAYISTGVEGDASRDRRLWCFMINDSLWNVNAVCSYDMNADSVLGVLTSFPDAVNFTTADATGQHVLIGYDSHPYQSFYPDLSGTVNFPAGAAGHGDIALTADSQDVMVYQNSATDYIAMADLATGSETPLVAIPFNVNADIGLHVSGNCYATPGWALISTYGAKNPPSGQQHSWMDNLLFMVELKANPRTVKLCQTRSYTAEDPEDTEKNYFAEAFASINRTGTRVVFGSNWGILSPNDYTDAYQVSMPSGWNQ